MSFQNISPTSLRIVFMGTPEFAVASLSALLNAGMNIVGVITAPDKQAGRGMKLTESAIKKYALEKSLKILQPEKLKNETFIEQLRALSADIQIVVAFRMLPEVVWNMPNLGTINLHGSLLPQYRGAAPINWAIINGEKETGVTTFKLEQEIDKGNILLQEKINIREDENAGELHDEMKKIGGKLLVKTINELCSGTLKEINQTDVQQLKPGALHPAPKIFTETCKIDWSNSVKDIYNLVRGLSPHPAAFTFLNDKMIKIFKSEKETTSHTLNTGSIQTDNKSFLKFACPDGFISIKELQPEGKRKMSIEDFLRGYRVNK